VLIVWKRGVNCTGNEVLIIWERDVHCRVQGDYVLIIVLIRNFLLKM
jgi:hypothetical protein